DSELTTLRLRIARITGNYNVVLGAIRQSGELERVTIGRTGHPVCRTRANGIARRDKQDAVVVTTSRFHSQRRVCALSNEAVNNVVVRTWQGAERCNCVRGITGITGERRVGENFNRICARLREGYV